MKWWQAECKYGDMIRVSFGSFYHYGIYSSDDEIIQFGLPPAEGLLNRKFDEIAVCITDIDTFSMGKIVEVASLERGDKQKRLSPDKTVLRARSRVGERGYDILHNNCEHFARYCYFGEKRCEVTEGVIDSWKKKSKCDIYISRIPENITVGELLPAERNAELASVKNELVRLEKYWSWRTLEYALFRSFGYKMSDLKFTRSKNGKWLCDKCFFSISHSGGYVAVAVSNMEIGIDVEDVLAFEKKCKDGAVLTRMRRHIVGKRDPYPETPFELLRIWTQKESIFKCKSKKSFNPARIKLTDSVESFTFTHENTKLLCSVMGADTRKSFLYYYDGEETSKIRDIVWI